MDHMDVHVNLFCIICNTSTELMQAPEVEAEMSPLITGSLNFVC
jgi:hypothetical protein